MRFYFRLLVVYWNLTAAALLGLSGLSIAALAHYRTREDWLAVSVLLYFIALCTAAAPDVWRRIHATREMRRRQLHTFAGTCRECGYSLHASIGQCPECGTPIPADARPSLSLWHHVQFRPDLSDAVKAALATGREAAIQLRHGYIGTEHLLLGVARIAEKAEPPECAELDISAEEVEQLIRKLVGTGKAETDEDTLSATPAANRVLHRAMELQRAEGVPAVLLRHMVQALRTEPECAAAHLIAAIEELEHRPAE